MCLRESTFYNISFTMSRTKSEISQEMKKQKHIKAISHISLERGIFYPDVEMSKDFKSANITIIKDLK